MSDPIKRELTEALFQNFQTEEIEFLIDLYLDWVNDAWEDLEEEEQEFHEDLKRRLSIYLIDIRGA